MLRKILILRRDSWRHIPLVIRRRFILAIKFSTLDRATMVALLVSILSFKMILME